MSLHNYITERLKITSNSRSATPRPTSKNELELLIQEELELQGPDADLNFIDTSEITDMSYLFWGLNIGNIKIDQWETSNVKYLSNMFYTHKK